MMEKCYYDKAIYYYDKGIKIKEKNLSKINNEKIILAKLIYKLSFSVFFVKVVFFRYECTFVFDEDKFRELTEFFLE